MKRLLTLLSAGLLLTVQAALEEACVFRDLAEREFRRVGDSLTLPADRLNPASSSIAFRLKELDAAPATVAWNPVFQWRGNGELFSVGRLWDPNEYAAVLWRDGGVIAMTGGVPAARPRPAGEWHHYLATWQRNLLRLYIDGEFAGEATGSDFYFRQPEAVFTLGRAADSERDADGYHTGRDLSWADPVKAAELGLDTRPYGAYALADVMLFDRALSPAEARLLASGPTETALAQEAAPSLELIARPLPGRQALRLLPVVGRKYVPGEKVAVRIPEAEAEIPLLPDGPGFAMLDFSALPPGEYPVEAELIDAAGRTVATAETTFQRPEADPWLGNRLGAEDVVLPGFEPLQAAGDRVEVWGRSYDFSGSIFPTRIVNQGFEVLASPVDWQVTFQGQSATLQFDRVELESASPTRAVYTGSGRLGPLAAEGQTSVEYDGFIRCRITFTPPEGGVTVDDLRMRLEVFKEESPLFFYTNQRTCDWPADGRTSLTPIDVKGVITIANADRCLQWLTESDQYYYPEDAPDALQTGETAAGRFLDTVVIAEPLRIDAPFTLEFALQAGPVKARPAHWRGLTKSGRRYLDPALHTDITHTYDWWARNPGEVIPQQGFPEPADPSFMAGVIPCASMHFGGFRLTLEAEDPNRRSPEWARYEAEWERIPRRILSQSFPGWNQQSIDTRAASWGDWHVWCVSELLRTTGVKGLYYDDWMQGASTNQLAGSGYLGRSGERRATHDIFNQREFHRRVYALVKQYRGGDGWVILHTSGSIYLPVIAFCDVIYEGEVLCWTDRNPPGGNYFDTYRNDIFQILMSARQYGPPPAFHDISVGVATRETVGPAIGTMARQRQLWALLLLHDIHCVGGFTFGADELRLFWLDHFGIAEDDVGFRGYWDDERGAYLEGFRWPHDADRASVGYVSVYTRPGEALLIVVRDAPNNYAGPSDATVRLDRGLLGLPQGVELEAWDMESLARTPLGTVVGDVLTVPVGVDDYAAVLVKEKK